MIPRALTLKNSASFFLLGPRGVGKTTWAKATFPNATYINLSDINTYNDLVKSPVKIFDYVKNTPSTNWVIIDEITEIPLLSYFVKSLITEQKYRCALISSNINDIANKMPVLTSLALPKHQMFPLTAYELGEKYNLDRALQFGHLPATFQEQNPQAFLQIYLYLFLREEVYQGKLVQNLSLFTRFLEVMSLYQACGVNISEITRLAATPQNVTVHFLELLSALFFGNHLPCFDSTLKLPHKFYLFDVGVLKTVQPKKNSVCNKEFSAIVLETLVFQELLAINHYFALDYKLSYWSSNEGKEINFIAQNAHNLIAFALKNTTEVTYQDFVPLLNFYEKHPEAKLYLIYLGEKHYFYNNIEIISVTEALRGLPKILKE